LFPYSSDLSVLSRLSLRPLVKATIPQYSKRQKALSFQTWAVSTRTYTGETTTPFIDIPASESTVVHNQEDALKYFKGSSLKCKRRELLKTKVNVFLKVVGDRDGLLPRPHIYDEFVLDEDRRTLYLKGGLKRVTLKNNSTRYLALKEL